MCNWEVERESRQKGRKSGARAGREAGRQEGACAETGGGCSGRQMSLKGSTDKTQ